MNLLHNTVVATNRQTHCFILHCSLTIAATGKRNIGSGCWFYDSEITNYVFVKTPKHFDWPCFLNFIIAKYSLV
jgi:hypothetical protein